MMNSGSAYNNINGDHLHTSATDFGAGNKSFNPSKSPIVRHLPVRKIRPSQKSAPTSHDASWLVPPKFKGTLSGHPILVIVIMALSLMVTVTSAMAQSSGPSVEPGSPAGSYALNGMEQVNYFNGKLNFTLPFIHVMGRGEAQQTMVLNIERQWVTKWLNGTPYEVEEDVDKNKVGYGPGSMAVNAEEGTYLDCGDYYFPAPYNIRTTLVFTLPDGTEIKFIDQLTDGRIVDFGCNGTGALRGKVFVTKDGSASTFVSDIDIRDRQGGFAPSGYLMLRNGTRYRIDNGAVMWMRDRNGNTLTYTYYPSGRSDFPTGRVKSVTDSLNRTVNFSYDIAAAAPYEKYDQIDYKGVNGLSRTMRIYYAKLEHALRSDQQLKTYYELVGGVSEYVNPVVAAAVQLPNNRSYRFYYNSYAELARYELPTGGAVEFEHAYGRRTNALQPSNYRRLMERRSYPDGGTGNSFESRTTYSQPEVIPNSSDGYIQVDTFNSGGELQAREKHYYYGVATWPTLSTPPNSLSPLAYQSYRDGKEKRVEYFDKNGSTMLRSVDYDWDQPTVTWFNEPQDKAPLNNPRIETETTTLVDTHQISKRTFFYDDYNNVIQTNDYSLGNNTPGTQLIRKVITTYVTTNNGVNYATDTNIHLRNLPLEQHVYGGNIEVARTTYEYDKYTTDAKHAPRRTYPDIVGIDSNFNSSARGNVTAVSRWLLSPTEGDRAVTTYNQYDMAGNVVKAIDALSGALSGITSFDYTDNFGTPNGNAHQGTNRNTYAFATTSTNAEGHTLYTQYDYNLGQAVDSEEPNGTVVSYTYGQQDTLDRLTLVNRYAQTSSPYSHTIYTYKDDDKKVITTSSLNTLNDNKVKGEVVYDGFGRTAETHAYENTQDFINVSQKYDAMGRLSQRSNPYRPYRAEQVKWTITHYDGLGRVIKVTAPDQLLNSPDSVKLRTTYQGNTVTVTDQQGKSRKSTIDVLGRLTEVIEDSGGANYATTYTYDVLGNLRKVQQGTQRARIYDFDSLSRLKSADNPERGKISYEYDDNGNIKKMTDERPKAPNATEKVAITYTYDKLNRLKTRQYNDGTPNVAFYYDDEPLPTVDPVTNFDRGDSLGRPVAVTYGGTSSGTYYGYDALGRVKQSIQKVEDKQYALTYKYDLDDNLIEEGYPSGRVVKTPSDQVGRISTVTGVKSGKSTLYATILDYASHGPVAKMQLGNGLWEHTKFNARLQPTEIGLSSISASNSNLLLLTYKYGLLNSGGALDPLKNNGNLQSQTISVPKTGGALTLTQNYTYDEVNRLEFAQEKKGTAVQWKQTFKYDPYGNRTIDADAADTTPDLVGLNPSINPVSNRISKAGYTYDEIGNLTRDELGHTYAYDAENRLISFDGAAGATYSYDGEGHRIKKIVGPNPETIYVYDAMNRLVAEYGRNTASITTERRYLTQDHLGSTRVVTDGSKVVKARYDYLPFGEEINAGFGGRNQVTGYSSATDSTRQKFTQQERDFETGLDYFKARYYSSGHGRFISADSFGGKIFNPQTLNLYAYVLNNPLKWTDPTGHFQEEEEDRLHRLNEFNLVLEENLEPHILDAGVVNINISDDDDLPSSFHDWIPVWGQTRRMFFNMERGNFGWALGNFALASVEGGTLVSPVIKGGKAVLSLAGRALVRDAAEEVGIATAEGLAEGGTEAAAEAFANCFAAGTLVHTESGIAAIETIKAGDHVLSWNQDSQQLEYKTVVRTFVHVAPEVVAISAEGESKPIVVTPGHPLYAHRARENASSKGDDEGAWVSAGELHAGDEMRRPDGQWVRINKVERQVRPVSVYNFEVADNHDYFVTSQGILVHNQSPRIISRIHDSAKLVKEAERAGASLQSEIDHLTGELAKGNLNPGIGSRSLFNGIIEARSANGGRVYFRNIRGTIEILAKSTKANQDKVISTLQRLYGK